jgi:hypothetical protein
MLRSKIRGFLRSCRIVREGGIDYPCRNVRFNLHTDILPNENGKFEFNSAEGGVSIDLGQYKFSDDDGIFRLDIDRNERVPLPIQDPHKWAPGSQGNPMKRGLWEATAERPGQIRFAESTYPGNDAKVQTVMEVDVQKPRYR